MKDSTVSVRVEADIKNEAEDILQKLGIPPSAAINCLYRQIIYQRGIPFSLTAPEEPEAIDSLSETGLDAKLSHSSAQAAAGVGRPMDEVFDDLERDLRQWGPLRSSLHPMQKPIFWKSVGAAGTQ